jgi:Zn-dependent protease
MQDVFNFIFGPIGLQLVLVAILYAMMRVRLPVRPRVSLHINADPARVFDTIDIADGKLKDYGNSRVNHHLVDAIQRLYKFTYSSIVAGGRERHFEAFFRVAEHEPGKWLRLERAGIDGKSLNNELLAIDHKLTATATGTRLETFYEWGPRPLLAQLLARIDLLGGSYRLKGVIEHGMPNEKVYRMATAALGAVSACLTLATFYLVLAYVLNSNVLGLSLAICVLFALFIHEFGHLLAYRWIGQPWGRMMFLPFMGAIAMPKLPFESQAQAVFSALMGPGFSIVLAVLCALSALVAPNHFVLSCSLILGVTVAFINIFNLLPVEPLDGGVALRSIFISSIGNRAGLGMIICGLATAIAGYLLGQLLLMIFGAIAIVFNLRRTTKIFQLPPLNSLHVAVGFFGYVALTSAYLTLLSFFTDQLFELQKLSANNIPAVFSAIR